MEATLHNKSAWYLVQQVRKALPKIAALIAASLPMHIAPSLVAARFTHTMIAVPVVRMTGHAIPIAWNAQPEHFSEEAGMEARYIY